MKKSGAAIVSTVAFIVAATTAQADSFFGDLVKRKKEVAPVANETYKEGCGECHFLYQPGLLPQASWRKLMAPDALADHFGENAELEEANRVAILDFLVANSADQSPYKRSKKIMASLAAGDAPLRIIEVPYIKRKHDEIPERLVKGNDKVKSLSYCDKCHQQAEENNFDDDTVNIPGYGDWTW